jgi:predicted nucleic acid binding AN1-type Zn finger protein
MCREHCKKKTHLDFKCRSCNEVFCVKCRTPEDHKCEIKKEQIVLEKVVADKLSERA